MMEYKISYTKKADKRHFVVRMLGLLLVALSVYIFMKADAMPNDTGRIPVVIIVGIISYAGLIMFFASFPGARRDKRTYFIITNYNGLYVINHTYLEKYKDEAFFINDLLQLYCESKEEPLSEMTKIKMDKNAIQLKALKDLMQNSLLDANAGKPGGLLIKMDTPILAKSEFQKIIKYCNPANGVWDFVTLPKKTKYYDEIVKIIEMQNME